MIYPEPTRSKIYLSVGTDRMILKNLLEPHWFYWVDKDSDIKKNAIRFFKDDRDIVIAEENVLLNKEDDNARITICKDKDAFATIELDDRRATLKICDGTTHNLTVQKVNNKRGICYNKTYMIGEDLIEELKKEVEKGLFYFQKPKIKNLFISPCA